MTYSQMTITRRSREVASEEREVAEEEALLIEKEDTTQEETTRLLSRTFKMRRLFINDIIQ